jgi:hypothetical protein
MKGRKEVARRSEGEWFNYTSWTRIGIRARRSRLTLLDFSTLAFGQDERTGSNGLSRKAHASHS